MSNIQIFDGAKKKKLISKIEYLGIKKIPYLLIQTGKERVIAYSGSLSREEVSKITQLLSVEGIGLYFSKDTEEGMRLSIDALHALKDQVTENIVELDQKQEKEWFLGKNIELTQEQQEKASKLTGFVAVKGGEDIIGTGRLSVDKKVINNFLPKERRIRS